MLSGRRLKTKNRFAVFAKVHQNAIPENKLQLMHNAGFLVLLDETKQWQNYNNLTDIQDTNKSDMASSGLRIKKSG